MNDLKFASEQHLRKNLTENSVIPILILAEDCNAQCLKEHCLVFVLRHINKLGDSEGFQSLKSEPILVSDILKAIIEKTWDTTLSIDENIRISYLKSTMDRCFFLEDYKPFLNSGNLSDFEIHIGEKKFQSHKLILSARSPVFQRMLICEMKEALTNVVEIKDVSAEVFYELLR